ncbi:hypothetical protein Tco_0500382 [Tanacetum coccineum]
METASQTSSNGVRIFKVTAYWKLLEHDIVAVVKFLLKSYDDPTSKSYDKAKSPFNPNFLISTRFLTKAVVIKRFYLIDLVVERTQRHLSFIISGLISDIQSAFVSNRQILDGPFILNELFSWCKHKKFKAMVFKLDFEKAFDSIWFVLGFKKAIYGEDSALNSPSSLSKHSPWLDDLAFKHKLPRLYALDNYKQITVGKKISYASKVDTFRRPPRGGAEEEQLGLLLSRIDGLILTNIPECWVWSLEAMGEFSYKYVCQLIDDSILPKEGVVIR